VVAAIEHSPRVLVVDDEDAVLAYTTRVLRGAGYEVVDVSSGPEALRIVEAQRRFDVVVVDLLMPGMRGDEVARRIRQLDANAKVLYFTAYRDVLFKEKETLWEDEAFIEKPATVQGILEAVSLILYGHIRGPETGPH
jgi:CheY-like chemotaxis protein